MIVVRLKGGLGNQMFQYALGRSLAVKNNASLGLDLTFLLDRTPRTNFTFRDYNLDIFNIKAEIIPSSKISFLNRTHKGKFGLYFAYLCRKFLKIKGVEKNHRFDASVFNIGKNAYLDGYWQSYKYFSEIEDIIRQDFTLKDDLADNIKILTKEIKENNSVCVHIRRGDYIGNSHHEVVGKNYYAKGVEMIKQKTKLDKIYVFSDDIKWCKENIKFEFPTMFVDEEYAGKKGEGHLYLMSNCHNFIIPNSTFSWWAAWLSAYKEKIIICPKQWFGDESINTSDLIPESWIRI